MKIKDVNLLHSSEKCVGVEEAAQPERVWSAVVTPRVKLVVPFVQFYQPVAQTARLPRYLPRQSRLAFIHDHIYKTAELG